jgi:hypothetical protein
MSKFLLNLLLQISNAFVYSKIQFVFEKNFSLEFGPPGPASPVLVHSAPQAAAHGCSAHPGLRGLGVIAKSRFYFEFAQPGDDTFSVTAKRAPPVRFTPFPTPADPGRKFPALPLPRAAAPCLGCP